MSRDEYNRPTRVIGSKGPLPYSDPKGSNSNPPRPPRNSRVHLRPNLQPWRLLHASNQSFPPPCKESFEYQLVLANAVPLRARQWSLTRPSLNKQAVT